MHAVPGTPRWAVACAWVTVATVLPSSLWRSLVGLGVPLGWSQAHLDLERIPGSGTTYVLSLSVFSIVAGSLTLGLVYEWGERFPRWVPVLAGRRYPVGLVIALALAGAIAVIAFVVLSIVNWRAVSGFDGAMTSLPALIMDACYLPMLAWAPLLLAVLAAYVQRRRASVTAPV